MGDFNIRKFLKKFIIYVTVLFVLWIPISSEFFEAERIGFSLRSFILFYFPMNLIPFTALMLATPFETETMVKRILVGAGIIVVFTAFVSILVRKLLFVEPDMVFKLVYFYGIGRIAVPLLLWFAFSQSFIFGKEKISIFIEGR